MRGGHAIGAISVVAALITIFTFLTQFASSSEEQDRDPAKGGGQANSVETARPDPSGMDETTAPTSEVGIPVTRREEEERVRSENLRLAAERRLNEIDSYLNVTMLQAFHGRVVIAVRSNGTRQPSFEQLVATELNSRGVSATSGFLKAAGYQFAFPDLQSGNTDILTEIGVDRKPAFMLLIDVEMEPIRDSGVNDVLKTNTHVAGQLVSFDGSVVQSLSIMGRGAGFDSMDASRQAQSDAAQKIAAQIAASL